MSASLSADEQRVLKALTAVSDDYSFLAFKTISKRTRLPRERVRRACRSLTRKGLAKYQRGLWTEDGTPAGSGYAATQLMAARSSTG